MPKTPRSEKPRACANCSRAKAKCVWPDSHNNGSDHDDHQDQICQRCSNNSLECSTLHPGVKRKRGKATHAKIVEQKLDDIMSLLRRDRDQTIHATQSAEHHPHSSTPFSATTSAAPHPVDNSGPFSQPALTQDQPRTAVIAIVPGFGVAFSEADKALLEYMIVMVPQFPFVPLSEASAYDMYHDKPLLLKTILWACRPPGPDATVAFEAWFRQHIAQQTVVLVNKSLEILQAILVFLAWKDIFFYASSQDTSLLQLAIGMVGDLGLTKRSDISGPASGSIYEDAAHLRNDVKPRTQHTSADRRAALGVYYITSILSSLLGRPSRLEYTPYFDHCCDQILRDQEYSTDSLLVNLIRIRQIANRVTDTFHDDSEPARDRSSRQVHALAITAMQKELDVFMDHVPEHLRWNHLLRSHCAAIRIRLFEPLSSDHGSDKLEPPHLRSQMTWDCLRSTQMLFDTFLLIPVETYPQLTFAAILDLALAIIKASRLLCMGDQNWDLRSDRTNFNFQNVLQQLIEHFEACSRIGSPRCTVMIHGRPLFSTYAENYKSIKAWYLSKCGPSVTPSASTTTGTIFAQGSEQQESFEFWQHLSDVTYGFLP